MKILKETTNTVKEALPISFLTDTVSKGWDEVGYLKDACESIREAYTDTAKVVEYMQDLMDAYLVFIGRIENHLKDIADLAIKDESEDEEKEVEVPKKEDDEDDKNEDDEDEDDEKSNDKSAGDAADNAKSDGKNDEYNFIDEPAAFFDDEEDELPVAKVKSNQMAVTQPVTSDPFEFFVDFDEPDMSVPRISEEELYGTEDSEYEYNKIRSQMR